MRFTSNLLLGAAIAAMAAPAFAGGPVTPISEIEVIAPVAVAPSTPFAGGYVGADLGYAFKGTDDVGGGLGELELSGALVNLHAGYRWQPGIYVWGVELGVEGGKVDDSITGASSELNHAVSLRAISGWTPNEQTLIYGFGGVSHGDFDYSIGPDSASFSSTGYVVGFGAERLLNDRWSVRGEYQYSEYENERLELDGLSTNASPKFHSVRVGVNYRF